jgi:hypothetical protein
MSITDLAGMFLCGIGLIVSVLFWVPGVINRPRLKELLGPRYPTVYIIYAANGPFLVVLGLVLLYVL